MDAKFAFWVFCLPKIQGPNLGSSACLKFKAQALDAKFAFWVFCLPKIQGPNLGCQVCILGLLPAEKFKPQTVDTKFAFSVFCLPKIQGPNLGCNKVCILGLYVSSACLKIKAQTLDAKFAFWVFCLPKIQGPNLGLLPTYNPRPKPWMHSLHSGSSACLKIQAHTLDAKFAFWVFRLLKIQGPNLGCKVCILGLLPA